MYYERHVQAFQCCASTLLATEQVDYYITYDRPAGYDVTRRKQLVTMYNCYQAVIANYVVQEKSM